MKMDIIKIENLEVYAYHGVYPEENKLGQTFYINAALYMDTRQAGLSDELALSTNYGEVCHFMTDWMKQHTCKLIEAVAEQLAHGYNYYFAKREGQNAGFLAYYPREGALYLSKLYLYKDQRGKGFSRVMLEFLKQKAKELGLNRIELNVNRNNPSVQIYEKLGFTVAWTEKNDIGNGFYMDDYVYALEF